MYYPDGNFQWETVNGTWKSFRVGDKYLRIWNCMVKIISISINIGGIRRSTKDFKSSNTCVEEKGEHGNEEI